MSVYIGYPPYEVEEEKHHPKPKIAAIEERQRAGGSVGRRSTSVGDQTPTD